MSFKMLQGRDYGRLRAPVIDALGSCEYIIHMHGVLDSKTRILSKQNPQHSFCWSVKQDFNCLDELCWRLSYCDTIWGGRIDLKSCATIRMTSLVTPMSSNFTHPEHIPVWGQGRYSASRHRKNRNRQWNNQYDTNYIIWIWEVTERITKQTFIVEVIPLILQQFFKVHKTNGWSSEFMLIQPCHASYLMKSISKVELDGKKTSVFLSD